MRTSRAGTSSSPGFSLLELITVLFLVSLVMALVLPSFTGFGEHRLKSESREMASVLRYVQDSAAARKETCTMKFNLDTNQVSWKGPEGEKTRKFDTMTGVTTQSTGLLSKGELLIFFEPLGVREDISVQMNSGEKTVTVTLHHLSGKVKIKDEG